MSKQNDTEFVLNELLTQPNKKNQREELIEIISEFHSGNLEEAKNIADAVMRRYWLNARPLL